MLLQVRNLGNLWAAACFRVIQAVESLQEACFTDLVLSFYMSVGFGKCLTLVLFLYLFTTHLPFPRFIPSTWGSGWSEKFGQDFPWTQSSSKWQLLG